jgi:hypothetical protein
MDGALFTVKPAAGIPLKVTTVARRKFVPRTGIASLSGPLGKKVE